MNAPRVVLQSTPVPLTAVLVPVRVPLTGRQERSVVDVPASGCVAPAL